MDWKTQHKKLSNQMDKFSCGYIATTGSDGKKYEMLCMPIKKLNGWLFSINPNKVRSDLKKRLEGYQEECFLALWDYWTTGIARRDEVKCKLAEWEEKKREYESRASKKGKALQECKAEKRALKEEFINIKQMDLFLDI